jgi:glycosyltransferase involved in cell wall biosynthesis
MRSLSLGDDLGSAGRATAGERGAGMRIWILNHYASPPDRPAGTRHYDFGRVLAAQGHDITIFASSFSHFSRREERLKPGERTRAEIIDGVRFVWIRTTPYSGNDYRRALNMISYALGVLRAQRRFARPDVIVGSNVHLVAVAVAWVIGCLRRVPFVFEVRDVWPRTLIDMGALAEGSAAARVLTGLERFLYRRASKIITLLAGAPRYIEGHGIPADKVAYIPNGIADYDGRPGEAAQASPAATTITSWIRQRREAGYLIAGYVGSHGRVNGVELLVDTARDLRERAAPKIAFVFIGDGPDKERCAQLAQDYGLPDVAFWPPVPKHDIPAILQTLDVALFCMREAAMLFGYSGCNKLFDYLASGRPIVAACAMPDNPVSASGGGICVPPDSPSAVGDALLTLSALDDAGRKAMGERGAQWVYRHHGVTDLADRFLTVLTQARQ